MASPDVPLNPEEDIEWSDTGTCQGPTNWSLAIKPVTVRSPIVMRKFLLATVGCLSTFGNKSCIS